MQWRMGRRNYKKVKVIAVKIIDLLQWNDDQKEMIVKQMKKHKKKIVPLNIRVISTCKRSLYYRM